MIQWVESEREEKLSKLSEFDFFTIILLLESTRNGSFYWNQQEMVHVIGKGLKQQFNGVYNNVLMMFLIGINGEKIYQRRKWKN